MGAGIKDLFKNIEDPWVDSTGRIVVETTTNGRNGTKAMAASEPTMPLKSYPSCANGASTSSTSKGSLSVKRMITKLSRSPETLLSLLQKT